MIEFFLKNIIPLKCKKLLLSGILILVSCFFWSGASACDKFSRKKQLKNEKTSRQLCMFIKLKKKKLKYWSCFFKNVFVSLAYKKNFENFYLKKYTNGVTEQWKNTEHYSELTKQTVSIGKTIEKAIETDKWDLNHFNLSANDILLCDMDLICIDFNFFLYEKFFVINKISVYSESIYTKSISNLENQINTGLMYIYAEIKKTNSSLNFLLDKAKGFVFTDICSKSNLKSSNRLKIHQKYLHPYSKDNLLYSKNNNGKIIYELINEASNKVTRVGNFESNQICIVFNFYLSIGITKNFIVKNRYKNIFRKKNKIINIFYKKYGKKMFQSILNIGRQKKVFPEKKFSIFFIQKRRKKFTHDMSFTKKSIFFSNKKISRFQEVVLNLNFLKINFISNDSEELAIFSDWISELKKKKIYKPVFWRLHFLFDLYSTHKLEKSLASSSTSGFNVTGLCYRGNLNKKNKKHYFFFKKNNYCNSYAAVSSVKICFYARKRIDNFLFSHFRKLINLNETEGLNFLAKSFCTGMNVPVSFIECYKFHREIFLGGSETICNLSEMCFYGKGVECNKENFRFFCENFLQWSDFSGFFNFLIFLKNIKINCNIIRIFEWTSKIFNLYSTEQSKTEREILQCDVLSSTITCLTKESLNKLNIHCILLSLNTLLIGFIQEKKNLISLSMRNLKKIFNCRGFFTNSKIDTILTENEQLFLATEFMKKYYKFDFYQKTFCFIFKTMTGNGFSINCGFGILVLSQELKKNSNPFIACISILIYIFSNASLFFFYIKFILTNFKFLKFSTLFLDMFENPHILLTKIF